MKTIMNINERIGTCCVSALLYEVSVYPKPGLVDPLTNGAHQDMNFFTFISSIAAISHYFTRFAEYGRLLAHIDDTTLSKIRPLGIECEEAMFKATNGVNTHKGAIFSLGIIATAAAYCYKTKQYVSADMICDVAGAIAQAAQKDFSTPSDSLAMTKGRKLYAAYGIKGIRGEAASGFYSVRMYALPVMKNLFSYDMHSKNDIYLETLLHLMTKVEDTNVISRCGIHMMEYVRSSANKVLGLGGALSVQGKDELIRMDQEYTKRNISPGGCADLLSVAIALDHMEKLLE
ncbi:triphosphoribosyl-dephospho-CoA synthase CitG [Petroclostridium sp. X23]|uniref:triphosphoribosyl-dephospho-CoA synthase CitG n=1 Tax=Petroclostridium sp. X23 TaxID=3045146 RepID=UPI0024AE542F|nr:triphosphoribosyl-dephospho-CoA synthase CitG [Petroclostridium sp. X23]WHH61195.1 triphosphoribosyl-dephospho-CoA synthase CitG [Petroclostridium sp. X23]